MTYKARAVTEIGVEMSIVFESGHKLGSKKNMEDAKAAASSIIKKPFIIERIETFDRQPLQGLTCMFDDEMTRQSGILEND